MYGSDSELCFIVIKILFFFCLMSFIRLADTSKINIASRCALCTKKQSNLLSVRFVVGKIIGDEHLKLQ